MRESSLLTYICVAALGAVIVFGFYIMEAARNVAGAPIPYTVEGVSGVQSRYKLDR